MKTKNNFSKKTITVATILLFMLTVVWTGTALGVSKRSLKRMDKEGPVEVTAIYLNPLEKAGDSELRFEVKLDTHSVNLVSYCRFDDVIFPHRVIMGELNINSAIQNTGHLLCPVYHLRPERIAG